MSYIVRIKRAKTKDTPPLKAGEKLSRPQNEAERKAWLANRVTSKYSPHQGKRECERRVAKEMW